MCRVVGRGHLAMGHHAMPTWAARHWRRWSGRCARRIRPKSSAPLATAWLAASQRCEVATRALLRLRLRCREGETALSWICRWLASCAAAAEWRSAANVEALHGIAAPSPSPGSRSQMPAQLFFRVRGRSLARQPVRALVRHTRAGARPPAPVRAARARAACPSARRARARAPAHHQSPQQRAVVVDHLSLTPLCWPIYRDTTIRTTPTFMARQRVSRSTWRGSSAKMEHRRGIPRSSNAKAATDELDTGVALPCSRIPEVGSSGACGTLGLAWGDGQRGGGCWQP